MRTNRTKKRSFLPQLLLQSELPKCHLFHLMEGLLGLLMGWGEFSFIDCIVFVVLSYGDSYSALPLCTYPFILIEGSTWSSTAIQIWIIRTVHYFGAGHCHRLPPALFLPTSLFFFNFLTFSLLSTLDLNNNYLIN